MSIRMIICCLFFFSTNIVAKETVLAFQTSEGTLRGLLTVPSEQKKSPLVFIIAGSGPTDMNGNQTGLVNNSLKHLSDALIHKGISTFRYDKRGVGLSSDFGVDESKITFDDFVEDANTILEELLKDKRFTSITVAGHSEGALIGMLISEKADKFIALNGQPVSADEIIMSQLDGQNSHLKKSALSIITSLKKGERISNIPVELHSAFRPSIQKYMASWFRHDPSIIIKSMTLPTLILNGGRDLQISKRNAERLTRTSENFSYIVIEDMNHVLKSVDNTYEANISSYNNPDQNISEELILHMEKFIKN